MNKFVYFPQHNAPLSSTKHLECISWPKKHFFLFGNNLKLARPNLYPLNCCIITSLPSTDSMLKQRQLLRIKSWPFSFMDVSFFFFLKNPCFIELANTHTDLTRYSKINYLLCNQKKYVRCHEFAFGWQSITQTKYGRYTCFHQNITLQCRLLSKASTEPF